MSLIITLLLTSKTSLANAAKGLYFGDGALHLVQEGPGFQFPGCHPPMVPPGKGPLQLVQVGPGFHFPGCHPPMVPPGIGPEGEGTLYQSPYFTSTTKISNKLTKNTAWNF